MYNIKTVIAFDHKSFGRIGEIDLSVDINDAEMNGNELGAKAMEYLIGYGVKQAFTDCYSQAKDAAKAHEMFAKKVEAVMSGKISIRERLDAFSRAMAELTLKAFEDSAKMTWAAFVKSVDDESKSDLVWERFAESVREELEPIARARLERESKLGSKVTLSVNDIMSALVTGQESTLIKKVAKK